VADFVDKLYITILLNGTHKAPSIKVAEAAKVIENSQRDINIAFMNELAKICSYFGIDTNDVLEAAGTKWNFLKFKPGLVGGHCIGIDPYYIAQKAEEAGYHPEIILAGRRMNDGMGAWIASQIVKMMIARDMIIKGASILMLGITFKENCPDIRNSKVIDLKRELKNYGCLVEVYDPWADAAEVKHEYGINLLGSDLKEDSGTKWTLKGKKYQAVVLAVAHDQFLDFDFQSVTDTNSVIYDVKGILPRQTVTARL
jgi:UDP-N-acetyl-D-galactosamine dehydrogenase